MLRADGSTSDGARAHPVGLPCSAAVTSQMDRALGAASPAPMVRADVRLLRPPSAAVKAAVWVPVCAVELDAMEHGWTVLWARLAGEAANATAQDTDVLER
eukprot:364737-Chlamydomonas_euryale.AAC.7